MNTFWVTKEVIRQAVVESGRSELWSLIYYLLATGLGTSYFPSVSLSFLICKVELIIIIFTF